MAGHKAFLPGRQRLVEVFQQGIGLAVQPLGLFGDVHRGIGAGQCPQFFSLAFNLGEGLFEIQIVNRALRTGPLLYGQRGGKMQLGKICGATELRWGSKKLRPVAGLRGALFLPRMRRRASFPFAARVLRGVTFES